MEHAHFALCRDLDNSNNSSSSNNINSSNISSPTSKNNIEVVSPSKEEYKRRLARGLLDANGENNAADNNMNGGKKPAKILAFKNKAPSMADGYDNASLTHLYSGYNGPKPNAHKQFRPIPTAPERILDAPELLDDYYLNLLDWSADNIVAVALASTVYLWNAGSGDIQQLMQCSNEDDYISSVSWAADGKHIAIGTSNAEAQIWDVTASRQVRSLKGHSARVSALAWNNATLSTGARDNLILNHDVRIREHLTSTLSAHEQEVCGLKWSPSGSQLASGGNDNRLFIWDAARSLGGGGSSRRGAAGNPQPLHAIEGHQAAVKALAWCPFQSNLLASGGGTADRCIKFWNTHTGALLNSVDTHSQVCALQWSKHERELLSSHGFSQNQLCLWKYPSMTKMAEFTGHSARVLHMAQSPDGYTVVSAAADETLRFWKAFGDNDSGRRAEKEVKAIGSGVPRASGTLRSVNIR